MLVVGTLRSVFNAAVRDGLVARNPVLRLTFQGQNVSGSCR
jgi:hypothetical protein